MLVIFGVLLSLVTHSAKPHVPASPAFNTQFKQGKLISLKCAADAFPTEYIAKGESLGNFNLAIRSKGNEWQRIRSADLPSTTSGNSATWALPNQLSIQSQFEDKGSKLVWRMTLNNLSSEPIEIGDLATPLPMNGKYSRPDGMVSSVLKHSFISGDGSFIFWMRPNAIGPFLMLTPLAGTAPEYWDEQGPGYQVYLHSEAAREIARSKGTNWRIPETHRILAPKGTATYGYVFQWVNGYQDVRDALAKQGSLDVRVVPGMTVPNDVDCEIALRSANVIDAVEAEFPTESKIGLVARRGDTSIYKVQFSKLGENRLTVHYGRGRSTYLEFFCTQPIETLIKKRAAFLARCRHNEPDKWFNGLISDWNMETQTLLGPENYDRITGWRIYEVSCDDPGLAKPAFLAAKNAEYPVQREVDALDDYIEHFVWGGLQQTDSEPYPFAIYGIPDWKTLRARKGKPADGVEHVWRVYDYPHVMLLYESMYRLASAHPEIHTRLPASEYLRRAFGTAQAMYTVPAKIVGWSAYDTGYYNERVMLDVIADLRKNKLVQEAKTLQGFWDAKTKFFLLKNPDLFGSEYAFDSTGFESTHAIARTALEDGPSLGIPQSTARKFMDHQIALNMFCRGCIEPAYYYLGSDYRGDAGNSYTLSYMSQMGGWAVLDYGLHFAEADPSEYVRCGYASYLSSWALLNSGTSASNYGYWYPGKANDGGAGGGFEPAPFGETWLGQPHHRGSWYYGCEIDLGYCGALRSAATVVTDDPIFGRICLGGVGRRSGSRYLFIPRDGLRKRLYLRTTSISADLILEGARFVQDREIGLNSRTHALTLQVECDTGTPGKLRFELRGPTHSTIRFLQLKPGVQTLTLPLKLETEKVLAVESGREHVN